MLIIRRGPRLVWAAAVTAFLQASSASAGAAIIIDPGHGGDDLGAVVGGRQEKDIALAVARKVRDRLAPLPVRLTRDKDIYLPLDHRIEDSLANGGAIFVSLHANRVKRRELKGITIYTFGRTAQKWPAVKHRARRRVLPNLPDPSRDQTRAGLNLAGSVARALRSVGFAVEPTARAPYYVLKNPRLPSILIELGYLSNPEESIRLADPAYQDKLALALAEGLRQYASSRQNRGTSSLAR